ncbi:MipA/OmpV family protein [Oleisolibacter albus]|uniref:MipA/OmpV family protein n=1 Tax=Oleisolibacter albus TaxID=2171757 RepID=UPI000DF4A4A9
MRIDYPQSVGSAAVGLLLLSLPLPALAQSRPVPPDGLAGQIGIMGMVAPDYEGSDHHDIKPRPYVDITYGKYLFFNYRGLGANLLTEGPLTAGVAVNYHGGRDQDDNRALRGLGDIDPTAVGTIFTAYQIGAVTLSADIQGDLLGEGYDGVTASLSAQYRFSPAKDMMLIAGPSMTWASDNYMQSYFGIDAKQSTRSGRPVYKADAGVKDVGVSLIGLYQITGHWGLTCMLGYKRLLGDAADSPLVDQDGTADQIYGALGLSYRF